MRLLAGLDQCEAAFHHWITGRGRPSRQSVCRLIPTTALYHVDEVSIEGSNPGKVKLECFSKDSDLEEYSFSGSARQAIDVREPFNLARLGSGLLWLLLALAAFCLRWPLLLAMAPSWK